MHHIRNRNLTQRTLTLILIPPYTSHVPKAHTYHPGPSLQQATISPFLNSLNYLVAADGTFVILRV